MGGWRVDVDASGKLAARLVISSCLGSRGFFNQKTAELVMKSSCDCFHILDFKMIRVFESDRTCSLDHFHILDSKMILVFNNVRKCTRDHFDV